MVTHRFIHSLRPIYAAQTKTFLFCCIMCLYGSPLFAQPNDAADAQPDLAFGAYQRGYYLIAFKEAMARVDKNPKDAAAMTLIAETYKDGLAVKYNMTEASHWYRLAAQLGDRQAIFALGLCYLHGTGVEKNTSEARHLFQQAATLNHPGAFYNLGILSLEETPPNFKEAAGFFTKAAELEDADAAYALAMLYKSGQGVEKNLYAAAGWLSRAAQEHHVGAEIEYAIALFNGEGVTQNEEAAARYFLKAANENNPIAQNRLARLLVTGRGIKKDLVEAAKWHILARSKGVKDPWLDQQIEKLTPQEQAAVEVALRKYIGQ